ncbi:MAG: hypothetical protein ACYDBJ_19655 [Aggregatilineales bacterium]
MSYDDRIDPQELRARVLRRIEPQLRLQRQKAILIVHIVLFIATLIFVMSGPQQGPFWLSIQSSYTDPSGVIRFYPEYQIAPLVSALGLLWYGLLMVHAGWVFLNHARERLIRREVEREYELEKMRLQVELIRANRSSPPDPYSEEKRKRSLRLADDGELAASEDVDTADVQQRSRHRQR